MEIRGRRCHDCLVITVAGDIDLNTESRLSDYLHDALESTPKLVVDLSEAGLVSAAGLAILARTGDAARARGGWLRATGASGLVRRSLVRAALQDKVPLATHPEAACHGDDRPQTDPPD